MDVLKEDGQSEDLSCKIHLVDYPSGRQLSFPTRGSFKRRLATYPTTAEHSKEQRILAAAGFSYKDADKVACIDCGLELYKSTQLDTALQEHLGFKPSCPFISRNYRLGSKRPAKHPEYREYAARLDSFVSWPGRYVPQTPENSATAGFFYIGSADRVTCFQCGITLRDWEEEHDPAAEHQKYSPNCAFINEPDLGQLGVATRLLPDLQTDSVGIAGASHSLNNLHITADCVGIPPAEEVAVADAVSVVDARTDDMTKTVGDMGFSTIQIQKAGDMFRQKHNRDCQNVAEFVDYILDMENKVSHTEKKISQKPSSNTTSGYQNSFEKSIIPSDQTKIPESKSRLTPLVAENQRLRDKKTCTVCGQQDISILFLPCGHLVTCRTY